jgi:hypothetical protein
MLDNTIMDIMDRFSNQLTDFLEENLINLDEDIYPSILTLLAINLTLPFSVASAERSFSSLKRLKTEGKEIREITVFVNLVNTSIIPLFSVLFSFWLTQLNAFGWNCQMHCCCFTCVRATLLFHLILLIFLKCCVVFGTFFFN